MLSSSWERSKYVGLLGEHYYRKKLYLRVVFAEEKQTIIARNCRKLQEIAKTGAFSMQTRDYVWCACHKYQI